MTDELAQKLRGSGYRLTPQRRLILAAVEKLGHATPDDVACEVRETGINTSTVYRTLEVLEELGLVRHTHLSDRAPTYHASSAPEHLHVVCRACGAVRSVPPEVADPMVEVLVEQYGFVVDVAHLALFGTCTSCGSTPETPTPHHHPHAEER